jgi:hypothetical protein
MLGSRKHHEVAPWFLGAVPQGETRYCDALTMDVHWSHDEPVSCSRAAHVTYGELALCWQHEEMIIDHVTGDERTIPPGMGETRFCFGAIEKLEIWLDAKNARGALSSDSPRAFEEPSRDHG